MPLRGVNCQQLADFLASEDKSVVAVDVRSGTAFNAGCLRGALNWNMSSLLRRRARRPGTSLKDIAPEALVSKIFEQSGSEGRLIIVYDDEPRAQAALDDSVICEASSNWLIVATKIQEAEPPSPVYVLQDGFRAFAERFGELCMKPLVNFCRVALKTGAADDHSSRRLSGGGLGSFSAPVMLPGVPASVVFSLPAIAAGNTPGVPPAPPTTATLLLPGENRAETGGAGRLTEVLPHLLLGNAEDSADLERLLAAGVTNVLNVTCGSPNYFSDRFAYSRIAEEDKSTCDLAQHFHSAIQIIEDVRVRGGKVLVHCAGGVSRSPSICIAYLIATRNMTTMDAFHSIQKKRPSIGPNAHFMGQLLHFQEQMISCSAVIEDSHSEPHTPEDGLSAEHPLAAVASHEG